MVYEKLTRVATVLVDFSKQRFSNNIREGFQVKCSDNALYKVRPVFAIVEPGTALGLEITRSAGPGKEDKIVLQWTPIPPTEQDPMAPFKQPGQFQELRLPLTCAE